MKELLRETESFQYLKSNYLNNSGKHIKESKTATTKNNNNNKNPTHNPSLIFLSCFLLLLKKYIDTFLF